MPTEALENPDNGETDREETLSVVSIQMTEVSPQPDREEHGPMRLRAGGQVLNIAWLAAIGAGYSSPFSAAGRAVWIATDRLAE